VKTSLRRLGALLSVALLCGLSPSATPRGAAGVPGGVPAARPDGRAELRYPKGAGREDPAPVLGRVLRPMGTCSLPAHVLPINVSESPADSRFPVLAVSSDQVHVVWEENGRIYHRFSHNSAWSAVRGVATGEQPVIAMDGAGTLHLILVNEFGGNYEIYHCRWNGAAWSLPRNVSNTSGVSSAPSLAIAADGTLHVVWADNTPGYNVIYHALWDGRYWINAPIPNALGGAPAVAVSPDGAAHVVWQDRDTPTAPYDIYHSEWRSGAWTLPEDLSETQNEPSIIPDVTSDSSNRVHVVWQERINGQYAIYYAVGRTGSWSQPESASDAESDAYLPCVSVGTGNVLYAGWDESTSVLYRQRSPGGFSESPVIVVASDPAGVSDVRLALDGGGRLHAVWAQRVAAGNRDVFYARLSFETFLPVAFKRGGY